MTKLKGKGKPLNSKLNMGLRVFESFKTSFDIYLCPKKICFYISFSLCLQVIYIFNLIFISLHVSIFSLVFAIFFRLVIPSSICLKMQPRFDYQGTFNVMLLKRDSCCKLLHLFSITYNLSTKIRK